MVSEDYLIDYNEIRDPYLSCLSEEARSFILDPANEQYIELAMDMKERTANPSINHHKEMKR